jgi:ubiquinone/menaquinone biosynthesis C-methylase UbiE
MQVYDEVFVPRLFTPWAELLLDAVEPGAGEALLDVATGPGTVARLAAVRRAAAPITVNGVVRSETAAHVAVGYAP